MKKFCLFGAVLVMGLTGCGNDPESFASARLVQSLVTERGASGSGAQAPVTLTREILSQILTPVMLVRINTRGQQALIGKRETNGDVETWSTVDGVNVSLQNGVVVATRGLGADLMAASGPSAERLLVDGASHIRIHTTLDGLDQPIKRRFACTISSLGQQTIDVVEVSYRVTHVVEVCESEGTSVRNDYWIDSARKMRKVRQWIGQEIGHIEIEDLRR